MSHPPADHTADPPADGAEVPPAEHPDPHRWARIESFADRFEADRRAGRAVTIEAAASGAEPGDRAALVRALIASEAELRRAAGEPVRVADYLGRFADLLPAAGRTAGAIAALLAPDEPSEPPRGAGGPADGADEMTGRRPAPPALPGHLRLDPSAGRGGLLGRGGMGAVWAVSRNGAPAAAKVLLPGAAAVSQLAARFAREAAILEQLRDPGVPRFLEYRPAADAAAGRRATDAYLLTERIAGETFEELLEGRRRRGRGAVDGSGRGNGRLRLFRRAVAVIARAHAAGVLHRDLKPANVMVGPADRSGRRRVVVLDWGMAGRLAAAPPAVTAPHRHDVYSHDPHLHDPHLHDPHAPQTETDRVGFTVVADPGETFFTGPADRPADRPADWPADLAPDPHAQTLATVEATACGAVFGSPPYMPPEQARGEPATRRSDVCSLGLIMAEILTGERARSGAEAEQIIAKARTGALDTAMGRLAACDARPELIALCRRCVAPDPADRPADAGALLRDLDALCVRHPKTGVRVWDPVAVGLDRAARRRAARRAEHPPAADPRPTDPPAAPRGWAAAAKSLLLGGAR